MGRAGRLLPAIRIGRALVDEADGDRAAGDRSGHPGAEMQRRAALQRRIDRFAIDAAQSGGRIVSRIGHARRRDHLAVALEGEADGVFHPVTRLVLRRRHPAGAQRGEHVADRIELAVIGRPLRIGASAFPRIFRRIAVGRDDRQLQILAERRQVIGKARPEMEDAAERRMAGLPAEHAARCARRRQAVQRLRLRSRDGGG